MTTRMLLLGPGELGREVAIEAARLGVEALATQALLELESEGFRVVPTARAAQLTMDREGIRRLAAEDLGLPTSPYRFADTLEDYLAAVAAVGTPCVVKPVMSSSGKGQSVVQPGDAPEAAVGGVTVCPPIGHVQVDVTTASRGSRTR